jgi:hypothetical protein
LAPDIDDFDPESAPSVYRDHVAEEGHGGGIHMNTLGSNGTPVGSKKSLGGVKKPNSEALLDLLDETDNTYSDLPPASSKQEDLHV